MAPIEKRFLFYVDLPLCGGLRDDTPRYLMGTIMNKLQVHNQQAHTSIQAPRKSKIFMPWSRKPWSTRTESGQIRPEIGPVLYIFWDLKMRG